MNLVYRLFASFLVACVLCSCASQDKDAWYEHTVWLVTDSADAKYFYQTGADAKAPVLCPQQTSSYIGSFRQSLPITSILQGLSRNSTYLSMCVRNLNGNIQASPWIRLQRGNSWTSSTILWMHEGLAVSRVIVPGYPLRNLRENPFVEERVPLSLSVELNLSPGEHVGILRVKSNLGSKWPMISEPPVIFISIEKPDAKKILSIASAEIPLVPCPEQTCDRIAGKPHSCDPPAPDCRGPVALDELMMTFELSEGLSPGLYPVEVKTLYDWMPLLRTYLNVQSSDSKK